MSQGTSYLETPIGILAVKGTASAIKAVFFVETGSEEMASTACTELAAQQLQEYFAGERNQFALNLAPEGTPFQQKVWQQLLTVDYGEMVAYQDIAHALGKPKASRAVGAANGQNPIAVIIPCHRIVGSNGKLTGYAGGIWRKEWLLRHEGSLLL